MIWSSTTGEVIAKLQGHQGKVSEIAFSPDGSFFASCSLDSRFLLWYLTKLAEPKTLEGHSSSVSSVAFSSDSEMRVSGSEDTTIRFWTRAGTACRGTIRGDILQVNAVAFSPDNKLVASASEDRTVNLWNMETKDVEGIRRVGVVVQELSFSPCGKHVETDRRVLDVRSFSFSSPPRSLTRPHSLFVTQDWLMRDMERVIWLPEEYCTNAVATKNRTIVMGHSSGSISFITL
jgi:WD40 repeat protein